jgi:acetyltransferase-like isoleucine patch superfamily enzyme
MRGVWDLVARLVPSNAVRVRAQRAKGVKVGQNVFLGYDVLIDVTFPELVEIEDHARLGPGAIVLAHSRPGDAWMPHMGERREAVRIKRHAAIYAGAIVTPGVTVGEYAIVKEGAVVVENVPPFTVVAGNPARVIEQLPKDKLVDGGRGHPP